MKYVHPDIVVGEPIPEIEPRVDEVMLRLVRRFNRRSRGLYALFIPIWIGFVVWQPGLVISLGVSLAIMVFWLLPVRGLLKHWKVKKKSGETAKKRKINDDIPFLDQAEYLAFAMSGGLMFFGLLSASTDGVSGVLSSIGTILFICGTMSFLLSRMAREPGQICCDACEYPLVGLTLPCACPECGRALVDGGSTTDRPRVRSRWFFWAGGGLALLGLLFFASGFFQPPFYYGFVSQRGLTRLAMSDSEAFNRLVALPMTNQERDDLIEELVSRNEGLDGWGFDTTMQGLWLDQYLGTPVISQEQLDRILERAAESIRFDCPESARVGEMIRVELESERMDFPGVRFKPWYFSRGFVVGEGAGFSGTVESARFYADFYRDWPTHLAQSFANPGIDITAIEAGPLVIRVRLVVAVFPRVRHSVMNVDWSLDEDAMFETLPIWYRVVDLEHTIVIEP